ncbi:unnamed protein product, partial [Bubo scandiacus]
MSNGLSIPSYNARVTLKADSETQRSNYGHTKKKMPTCRCMLEERKEGVERQVSDLPKVIRMKSFNKEGSIPHSTHSAYLNGYFEGEKENKSISVNMM